MFINKRLDRAYDNARIIEFDDSRPMVFMSDCHRGDNSQNDEFGQNVLIYYHALQYYYNEGFTYVEAGDGDELWEVPDYKYIYTAHPSNFKLLRQFLEEDRLLMLWGNHNTQIKDPEYVKNHMTRDYDDYLDIDVEILPGIDPCESLRLRYKNTGQEIFVLHGHQGELFNDYLWPVTLAGVRYFWRFLHKIGFRYAANPARNKFRMAKVERKITKWMEDKDFLLICGHTHRPRFHLPSDASRYFNCGCCIHPRGITSIEMAYGEIALVNWKMHTRNDGMVFVRRTIIKGPERLEDYIRNGTSAQLNGKESE